MTITFSVKKTVAWIGKNWKSFKLLLFFILFALLSLLVIYLISIGWNSKHSAYNIFILNVASTIFASCLISGVLEIEKFNSFIGKSVSSAVINALASKNQNELSIISPIQLGEFQKNALRAKLNYSQEYDATSLIDAIAKRDDAELESTFITKNRTSRTVFLSEEFSDKCYSRRQTCDYEIKNMSNKSIDFEVKDLLGQYSAENISIDNTSIALLQVEKAQLSRNKDFTSPIFDVEKISVFNDTAIREKRVWDLSSKDNAEKILGKYSTSIEIKSGETIFFALTTVCYISHNESMDCAWGKFRKDQEYRYTLAPEINRKLIGYIKDCNMCADPIGETQCACADRSEGCVHKFFNVGTESVIKLSEWTPPSVSVHFEWAD